MARIARVVMSGIPHHVTQRGNRRQKVFFRDDDYVVYIELMAEWCGKCGVEVWAYCLMPNHVHLIAVPSNKSGLARGIGEAHRRYTRMVNFRENWRGYLWQGRFASFPLDEKYLYAAARCVEMNPVRARLVKKPWEYKWSSAQAHLEGKDNKLLKAGPLLGMVDDWREFLMQPATDDELGLLRRHERTGRPLGGKKFVEKLEERLRRVLRPGRPGRPKNK